MEKSPDDRAGIIKVITSPLGFFALSLLIVEGFLTIVLIFSDLEKTNKYVGMWIGAALFLLVVAGVWFLVFKKPEHLTFGEQGHLAKMRLENTKSWGTSDNPKEKSEIAKQKPSDT